MRIVIDCRPPRGRILCLPAWTSSAFEKVKAIPGKKRRVDQTVYFELSKENIAHLRSAFRSAEWIGFEAEKKNLVNEPRMPFNTHYPPTELQQEAFKASNGKKLFAFFEKPGAGKTKMVLDWAVKQWCDGEIDGLFVLSYAGVHTQWVLDEAPKHVHRDIPYRGVYWQAGKKLDTTIFDPNPNEFRVFAMNYESYATSPKGFAASQEFAMSGAMAAACDESQRIKTEDSVISETTVGNRDNWEARCIASGEPTPLGIQDYYSQFCFLDPEIIGVHSYEGFKGMFCRTTNDISRKVIGYINQEHMHKLMAPYVHVGEPDIKAKQIWEFSRFDLSDRTREAYQQLKDELLVDLQGVHEDEWIEYRLRGPLAKITKLREIACGRLTTQDGTVHQFDSNRLDLMQTIIDIYGKKKKMVVWSCFKEDHRLQKEALGDCAAVYNGDTKKNHRREIIEEFLDPTSSLTHLLGSTAAMGTGLNLQGSSFFNLYYCNNNNAGQRWQSERRLYRLGITQDVRNMDMIARNTVDVGTVNSNRRKRDISNMSINEFRSLLNDTDIDDDLFMNEPEDDLMAEIIAAGEI